MIGLILRRWRLARSRSGATAPTTPPAPSTAPPAKTASTGTGPDNAKVFFQRHTMQNLADMFFFLFFNRKPLFPWPWPYAGWRERRRPPWMWMDCQNPSETSRTRLQTNLGLSQSDLQIPETGKTATLFAYNVFLIPKRCTKVLWCTLG